jgi:hypothetical protein
LLFAATKIIQNKVSGFNKMSGNQGDQIGRIFAQCAIVYFGHFFQNDRSSPKCWATLFFSTDYVSILTIMGWATLWAIFSKNSSGHSAWDRLESIGGKMD